MPKILVVEDETDIRQLVFFTLQFAGFEVVQGKNGEEAILLAKQELPDLILMDVRMPKMDGFTAATQIKADPVTADIPIIFLSAKGQDVEIEQGMNVGAEDYLLKPFNPPELVDRIKSTLSGLE
ncbi:MAG: response regulator [Anaerolineae bacterium]|jgi:DNA-binding response OmpR family regulator|nr:response regulator [Anaerolineae bacterium]